MSQDELLQWLLAIFREAYYPHFEAHVEKLNAAKTEEEALRLAAPDHLSRVIGESIIKVASADYDIHADQFALLAEATRQHPRLARLQPCRELEEQFREEILRSLTDCEVAMKEYAVLYNEYCDRGRAFEGSSPPRGCPGAVLSEVLAPACLGRWAPLSEAWLEDS